MGRERGVILKLGVVFVAELESRLRFSRIGSTSLQIPAISLEQKESATLAFFLLGQLSFFFFSFFSFLLFRWSR